MTVIPARLLIAWLIYVGIIVYGSLIPFELRLDSFSEAWENFRNIPFLDLAVISRADWIANIILYVPLSFIAAKSLACIPFLNRHRALLSLLVILFGLLLAVAVEFAQTFIAPRTVSQNDLIAEAIGTVLGLLLWRYAGDSLGTLWQRALHHKEASLQSALLLYMFGYLFIVFFPFDFLVSGEEIRWKLASDNYGLILASCGGLARCSAALAVEAVAIFPLGILAAMILRKSGIDIRRQAFGYGLVIGVVIEFLQFFLASGYSQGASVIMRGLGFFAGASLVGHLRFEALRQYERFVRPSLLVAIPVYLIGLTLLNGWFSASLVGVGEALEKFRSLNFAPFYYHYFTSEPVALRSLLNHFAMYAPIGIGYWLWKSGWRREFDLRAAIVGTLSIAAILSAIMETGKLFVSGKHPDYTDVLIAVVAASLTLLFMVWLQHRLDTSEKHAPDVSNPEEEKPTVDETPSIGLSITTGKVVSILLVSIVGYKLMTFPVATSVLFVGLLIYAGLLVYKPHLWIVLLPALLPILDFGEWSGRLFFDEYDLFILVTLALLYWRNIQWQKFYFRAYRKFGLFVLLLVSYFISTLIGLFPLESITANSFSSYYSSYNSLRLFKAVFWLFLLMPFLYAANMKNIPVRNYFIVGSLIGLTGVILKIFWERIVFVGIGDFSTQFRVDGGFSVMHAGSGYVEAYLAFALPLLAAWIVYDRNLVHRILAISLFALGGYALMVTYSRGGYVAFAIALLLFLVTVFATQNRMTSRRRTLISVSSIVILGLAVSYPVFTGGFAQSRLSNISPDMSARLAHWNESLSLVDDNAMTAVFGMGLGAFPKSYLWAKSMAETPGTYRYQQENEIHYLQLGAGKPPIYLGQQVDLTPGKQVTLKLRVRSAYENAVLQLPICEKNLLYSFRCDTPLIRLSSSDNLWHEHELRFAPFSDSRRDAKLFDPPLIFSLYNPSLGTTIDIDSVALLSENGVNLLQNGDFSENGDRWLFTSDTYWPWHVENMFLQMFFDQGWLGVILFALLLLLAIFHAMRQIGQGDLLAIGLLAALMGFVLTGLFSSLLDAPRFIFLFYLLLLVILAPGSGVARNEFENNRLVIPRNSAKGD